MKDAKKNTAKFQTPHEAKKSAATEQPAKVKPAKKEKTTRKGKLGELLGHSVVSVIRALGKAGWTYEEAKDALVRAGIEAADHTIRVGLKRGRDGQKKIAPLSSKELDTLRATPAKANARKSGKNKATNAVAA